MSKVDFHQKIRSLIEVFEPLAATFTDYDDPHYVDHDHDNDVPDYYEDYCEECAIAMAKKLELEYPGVEFFVVNDPCAEHESTISCSNEKCGKTLDHSLTGCGVEEELGYYEEAGNESLTDPDPVGAWQMVHMLEAVRDCLDPDSELADKVFKLAEKMVAKMEAARNEYAR